MQTTDRFSLDYIFLRKGLHVFPGNLSSVTNKDLIFLVHTKFQLVRPQKFYETASLEERIEIQIKVMDISSHTVIR